MIKAYDCIQCALWAHKNHDDENEAFWMRKALKSYRVEREQIVDVRKVTIWELGELVNVEDVLIGYYGEEAVA